MVLSAQTKPGSPAQPAPTARPPGPSLSQPLDPAWGRRGRRWTFSRSQHGISGCRPMPPPQPLRAAPASDTGGRRGVPVPGGPSPASLPSEPRASPPARRPPHPQRRAGARSGTSGTPAGLSGPHAPGPGPLESGSSPAAPGRAHRPRSPASPPPGRTAAAARGALARTGCRQGRGAGSAAGQEDVAVPQRDPARARPVPHRPSLRCLPKQAWPALRK